MDTLLESPLLRYLPLVILALIVIGKVFARLAQLGDKVTRLERKLDLLLKHQGVETEAPVSSEVQRLARDGQKIAAIKLLMDQTGMGLAEAKHAVEATVG